MKLLMGTPSTWKWLHGTILYLSNLILVPTLFFLNSFYPDLSEQTKGGLSLIYLIISGGVLAYIMPLPDKPNRTGQTLHLRELLHIQTHMVTNPGNIPFIQASMLVSIYVLVHLLFLLLVPSNSWVYWLLMLPPLLLLLLMEKEPIEHIASHSKQGVLINKSQATNLVDRLWIILEWVRVNLIWPLAFWFPNYYLCSHLLIHHVENNGPADFQSTLRYRHDSLLGTIKNITWCSLFTLVLPIDCYRYLKARKNNKMARNLLIGYLRGYITLIVLTLMLPPLGMAIILYSLTSGYLFYLSIMRWHGFHDATTPYSIEASNCSPVHYGHHKKPNIHLGEQFLLARTFWMNKDKQETHFPIFKSQQCIHYYERSFAMFVVMLWQGKYDVITKFIHIEQDNNMKLENYVRGIDLLPQNSSLNNIDKKASRVLGQVLERVLAKFQSKELNNFYYGENIQDSEIAKLSNFADNDPKQNKPRGIY
ncbi:hypothetical protein [Pseudoalteromonas maricaloris]|uniref:hypothetical protein n=1 Tax=Pseudoalteromonas maricaloris TaxID=184924 RepID=UPI003C28F781